MERELESYLRYLKGDQTGLRQIVESYWNSMLLFTNSYVHDLSEAEDIAQEALIRLTIKRPRFDEASQLKAYIFKICRNLSLNHLKKQKRTQLLHAGITEDTEQEIQEVHKRMELEEQKQLLHRAIGQLKQEYREVIYLRYFEGLSSREASRILRCTEKQLNSLTYQARQQLKKILVKEGYSIENL